MTGQGMSLRLKRSRDGARHNRNSDIQTWGFVATAAKRHSQSLG